ncbi:hypothetical protein [Arsenicicoccus dermatophilus]|uniref:hypothetical protein n=1 Tax=Arsenicicoccus dermatophilus TaxID=1076331 RepID=UPI001F4CFA11|nr:hypothetical protein [Arsenicicoccus dermatophilus]MCH8612139.1 hypothetical protein [Arsenicicoccus dermatophilus]
MTARIVRIVALAGAVALGPGAAAHAAEVSPTPLPAPERSAAEAAATSPAALDLARKVAARTGSTQGIAPTATPSLVAGGATEVNVLSKDFVARGAGPVARLGYVSNTVQVGDQTVSVWSVKAQDGSGWKAINAAAGDLEAQLARQAAGGTLFREPQINAWYAVKDNRVVPLNDEARKAVGPAGTTVAAYQRIVHGKYADKQSGSAYDRAGMAGGFGDPAAAVAGAPSTTATQGASWGLVGGGLGAMALAGLGAVVARRRRTV